MADTRLSILNADGQTAFIDIQRESTNSDGRQVIVVGDPDTNANVADVLNEDPGSSSTLQGLVVRLAGSATIVGLQGTTARPFLMNTDGAIKIYDVVTGTINTVTGVDRVRNVVDGTLTTVTGIDRVRVLVDGTLTTLTGITNSISVHVISTGGTLGMKLDPGYNVVNISSTILLPSTVSSTTSAVSVSGATLLSPIAGINRKIYAYSIQTTGIVSLATRFTNGAGTSPTEFWRPLVTAASTPSGANLAVTPPGYLFATGSNTTLALVLDSATLTHYSVSYFNESA